MNVFRTIDTALDRSIVLGYGTTGLALRRRLTGWPADPPRMDGKVVLVTGAASGLGLATATGFARLGASVRALARSHERARDAVARIQESVPGADVSPLVADVSSLASIRALAKGLENEPQLDVLVNNAGTMPAERSRSADGYELTFATHVLGPFALTLLLRSVLARSAPSRVINVSSGGMYSQALPAGDLESDEDEYSPKRFYARTKREQVVISEMLAERLAPEGISVQAMHPGWADTGGVRQNMPTFFKLTRPIIRTPEQGADTVVWLGGAPEAIVTPGLFWHDRRPRPTHYLIGPGRESDEDRAALWNHCARALERSGTDSAPLRTT